MPRRKRTAIKENDVNVVTVNWVMKVLVFFQILIFYTNIVCISLFIFVTKGQLAIYTLYIAYMSDTKEKSICLPKTIKLCLAYKFFCIDKRYLTLLKVSC